MDLAVVTFLRSSVTRLFHWTIAIAVAGSPALAQSNITLPLGQNLQGRPQQGSDVVLEINSAGGYELNGRPTTAAQLSDQLGMLLRRSRDRVVYIRADARLRSAAIDSANALVAKSTGCVASFVGTQIPGTMSRVAADAGSEEGAVYRAIDAQLPIPHAPRPTLARQESSAIVLEVLPGPTYRINTRRVPADSRPV